MFRRGANKRFSTQPLPLVWRLANIALSFYLNFPARSSWRRGRTGTVERPVQVVSLETIVPTLSAAYDGVRGSLLSEPTLHYSSARHAVISLAISTLVLALMLRTWLVMGLIEPVAVAGSSMAPNLRGPHVEVTCEKCALYFDIGAEFDTASVECPRCRTWQILSDPPAIERGDRLVIDHTAFQFRIPRRWEPVVFRSPMDGQLTVKRVVGLPGETIQLRGGEVLVNGKPVTKDIKALRALRQVVHQEAGSAQRWQGQDDWKWNDNKWQCVADEKSRSVLTFNVHTDRPLMTDVPYNNGVMQRLFPIKHWAISARVCLSDGARLLIGIGGDSWTFSKIGEADLEFYAYGRTPQVFVDGEPVERHSVMASQRIADPLVPIEIGVSQGRAELADLTVYRDTYYASLNEEHGIAEPMEPLKLKDDEIFVLGDNVPVSVDSRNRGPVPLRLLVGRPIGVR
jgi:signal peptidase I